MIDIAIRVSAGSAFEPKTLSEPLTARLPAVPVKGDTVVFRGVKHSVDAVVWTAVELTLSGALMGGPTPSVTLLLTARG